MQLNRMCFHSVQPQLIYVDIREEVWSFESLILMANVQEHIDLGQRK